MTNVRVGTKVHKCIEKLTVGKLEHLLQLANIEVTNYSELYDPIKSKIEGTNAYQYLKYLEENRNIIADVLALVKEKEKT